MAADEILVQVPVELAPKVQFLRVSVHERLDHTPAVIRHVTLVSSQNPMA
ncbi:MAG: hypothetical protein KGZ57_06385 [Dethiobacter sp.]|nr:hypothetical protein [Dethiobacter sp.]